MTKLILIFNFFLFFACNQNIEIAQDKPPLQSTMGEKKIKKIRMEKISEIHLKEQEEAYIGTILQMRIDKNRIYLMDKSHKQVLVFSLEGEFVRAFGRSGQGPGEFRYLYTMDVKDNLVACFDQGNLRMTLFDTSGVFIRSFGTRSQKSVPSGNCVAITPRHTLLHCQKPSKYPIEQSLSYTYPYLICEFDTLGNVLSYYGKFNQQIVGDKLDKPLTEFKWSFPQFIANRDSQTYLWFGNLPIVVEYDKSHATSKVLSVATSLTSPLWVDKEKKRKKLNTQERKNKHSIEHSIKTSISHIAYVDKYSILLVLQTKETRRPQFSQWAFGHYLSAYDVNTGHRVMTDMVIQPEITLVHFQNIVMQQSIAVDQDGFFYCIQSDKPDNFVIAKYEIIREEI